jgi:hypothetical protein
MRGGRESWTRSRITSNRRFDDKPAAEIVTNARPTNRKTYLPTGVRLAAFDMYCNTYDLRTIISLCRVDTLNGSRHKNMKELRFDADNGVWRFAFAFDPKRTAIVLCGGVKSGGSEQRFYRQLIAKADGRFDAHIADLKTRETKKKGKQPS